MTELLQTILLRVTIAGAVSAMALKLAGGGALKEVVRTAAGLLMLLALLQPLAGLHVLSWNWQGSVSQSDIDEMQARNMQTTMSTGCGEHCEGGAAACGGSRYSVHGERGDGKRRRRLAAGR